MIKVIWGQWLEIRASIRPSRGLLNLLSSKKGQVDLHPPTCLLAPIEGERTRLGEGYSYQQVPVGTLLSGRRSGHGISPPEVQSEVGMSLAAGNVSKDH